MAAEGTLLPTSHVQLDFEANTFAVDKPGERAVLRGRPGLVVVDLERAQQPMSVISLAQKRYETLAAVEYNPHQSHRSRVACTLHDIVSVWDTEVSKELMNVKAHRRPVTDIAWSPFHADIVASTSQDCDIHLWDVRDAKKPVQTFYGWTSGALQVKWNRLDENTLASAHGHEIKIWDRRRKDAKHFVTAHMLHIYGLDWSYTKEDDLLTCSQDKCVKFWTQGEKIPKGTLQAGSPVWRARFTPFGEGVAVMPRDDKVLSLWNMNDMSAGHMMDGPLLAFDGHTDHVKEFAWRTVRTTESGYQLLSLTKDRQLCFWDISLSLQDSLGAKRKVSAPPTPTHMKPVSLSQEFAMATGVSGVTIEQTDLGSRNCVIHAGRGKLQVQVKITFPVLYPHSAPPSFEFISKTISLKQKALLMEALVSTAQSFVEQNKPCLKPCLTALVEKFSELQEIESADEAEDMLTHDANMPCPRLAGVCFSANGTVLSFANFPAANAQRLPKTLSDLREWLTHSSSGKLRISDEPEYTVNLFEQHVSASVHIPVKNTASKTITCRNLSRLTSFNRDLAQSYRLQGQSAQLLCEQNAVVAASLAGKDVEQTWKLCQAICEPAMWPARAGDVPWSAHPFGGKLAERLVAHAQRRGDVQSTAVLAAVLSQVETPSGSPVHPPLLSSKVANSCKQASVCYGQLLCRAQLLQQHAELVKAGGSGSEKPSQISLEVSCARCGSKASNSLVCSKCRLLRFPCSICNVAVRGLSTFCGTCGHGGHVSHLRNWFGKNESCPTGCGCKCPQHLPLLA
eukprot:TRINITY_DN8660_c0_g1_i1.p1 TRINITY_DN8660_c0_g1~~TRINITY_DN8660_c0_g1_i1.p1  ORF type:complete len:804 (+),score=133.76 TRINITY_DN8660_c0_g1_i1:32-2413(+)